MSGTLSWGAALFTFLVGGGLGTLLSTIFTHRRGVRESTDDQAVKLLEQQAATIERLTALEKDAEHERALCEAQLSVLRHRLNNLDANFDAFLLLYEIAPEKAPEFVAKFKEQRAVQRQAEAIEKAAVIGAQVKGLEA